MKNRPILSGSKRVLSAVFKHPAAVKRFLLIVFGSLFILDTFFVLTLSNVNLGVILPALLGLPMLAGGIFFPSIKRLMQRKRLVKALVRLLLLGYAAFMLSFLITSAIIFKSAHTTPQSGAKAVIVLGAGIHKDQLTRMLRKRLDAAIEYQKENPGAIIIVSGGQGSGETIPEAEAMAAYLLSQGIAPETIKKEEAAASTQENFRFSKSIMENLFGDAPLCVFVTSDFHVFRATKVAKAEGLTASGIAAHTEWYVLPNCYLRECLAIWGYTVLGRF